MIHMVFFIKEECNPSLKYISQKKSLTNCKNLYKFDQKMV